MDKFNSMYDLFRHDGEAKKYFEALPPYVRDQIGTRADSVNSFASLRDYTENLLRGDD